MPFFFRPGESALSRRVVLAIATGLSMLGLGVSSALGASITIQPIAPDQIVGDTTNVVVEVTSNGIGGQVGVKYRPASGPPCGASFNSDIGQAAGLGVFLDLGPRTYTFPVTWPSAGRLRICAWVDDLNDEPTPLAASSVEVLVFEAPGTVDISAPSRGILGRPVQLRLSGQAPSPRHLFAKVRRNNGQACKSTFADDPGAVIGGQPTSVVEGAYVARTSFIPTRKGANYIVCAWLATTRESRDDPRPAVAQRTLRAVGPLSNLHATPALSRPRVSGRRVRVRVRTFDRGTLVVRLVGKGRDIRIVRRVFSGSRNFSLSYRRPARLAKGRYLLKARFTTAGRRGTSRPAQKYVVFR